MITFLLALMTISALFLAYHHWERGDRAAVVFWLAYFLLNVCFAVKTV